MKRPPYLRHTLFLVAQGLSNEEIGERLHLTREAIKSRMRVIQRYYGAKNRTHCVTLAFRAGDLVFTRKEST